MHAARQAVADTPIIGTDAGTAVHQRVRLPQGAALAADCGVEMLFARVEARRSALHYTGGHV